MKQLTVTTLTLTVQVTRITLRTWLLVLLKWTVLFLVVAATDGPMPQTQESTSFRSSSWCARIVVFMNKVDMVDDAEIIRVSRNGNQRFIIFLSI